MAAASTGFLIFALLLFSGGCRAEEEGGRAPALMCTVWNTLMEERGEKPNLNGFTAADLDDVGQCTHIVFLTASIFRNPNDTRRHWDTKAEYFRRGVELRNRRPGLKLLVTYDFSMRDVRTVEALRGFIHRSISALKQNSLDGAILERKSSSEGGPDFVQIFSEIGSEFRKHNLTFVVHLPNHNSSPFQEWNYAAIERFVDFVILDMNYFPVLSRRYTQLVNPLFTENSTIEWYAGQGIPYHKMVAMFPISVPTFRLKNANESDVGAETLGLGFVGQVLGPGQISSSVMMKMLKNPEEGWVVRRDEASNTPYAVNRDGIWVTYEDAASFRTKANYLKNWGFGGVLITTLEVDDFRGEAGLGRFPLVHAMHDALQSGQ